MRIGRQVAQNLVAIAGVATKAFGVPLPSSIGSGQNVAGSVTMDFSAMTATDTQLKLQNGMDKKNMDDLRRFAINALLNFPSDPVQADAVRQDLIRRLQPYIKQEAN